jgi:hypothetical protein
LGKPQRKLNRREFLKLAGISTGAIIAGATGCTPKVKTVTDVITETATQVIGVTRTVIVTAITQVDLATTTVPTAVTPVNVNPADRTPVGVTPPVSNPGEIFFSADGYTVYGDWYAEVRLSPVSWQPGSILNISTTLRVSEAHLAALLAAGRKADGICVLVTAERIFDANGIFRQASDEKMSTLLTPTRIAIEGGITGAATNRFGYGFRTPVDEYAVKPLPTVSLIAEGKYEVVFSFRPTLPSDLPPGIYRIRLDYGITQKTNRYSLNGDTFARRPFFKGKPVESHLYIPPVPASGTHISGRFIDAGAIKPRIPWVLLRGYNSNGYQGVVADEDRPNFALSQRNIIHDEVILPRFGSDNKTVSSYTLEPQFPTDTIEARSNIPWDYTKGELTIQVTGPDGKTSDLGTVPFVGNSGQWYTTKKAAFTAWKPPAYGAYSVRATGWTADIWGNRYEGGGTYRFWIAKRMTMATATFQGFAYSVGSKYGRDIGFAPAVPADVSITATLYPDSDPALSKSITFSGKASPAGIYGTAQGAQQLLLDVPGEYHAQILARYTDQEGHLWVCSMRHAGVVYPVDSTIVARGKKVTIGDKIVERGETHIEGWVESPEISHLQHINYPFYSGDVLLIASEQQGANKIEPVLTYEAKNNPAVYDKALQTIGTTNLRLKTSNGYSPHLFPEYINEWAYYYAGAPRPGFMSRFLVGEDGVRAPYWPTSPNSFGGQINASANGDLSGDIYRLIGGLVLRKKNEVPVYAGYLSSAFILPRYTQNNRIIAPGTEDLNGPMNEKARFFLVGLRPGMVCETGTIFVPVAQIDPILPVNINCTLTYPDGRQMATAGAGDNFGSYASKDRWTLDIPGVYRFWIEGEWQGYRGYMPGLPRGGGYLFVIEKDRPANVPRLNLALSEQSSFTPGNSTRLSGSTTASEVYYAAVIPGAVVLQGILTVNAGKFDLIFDPNDINKRVPTYDTVNLVTGRPQISDVVHLTLFSKETVPNGMTYHSFVRLIIRGSTVLHAY